MSPPAAAGAGAAAAAEPDAAAPLQWAGTSAAECRRTVEHVTKRDPTVRFLFDKLEEAGCAAPPGFVRVERCVAAVGGGFRAPDGVVLCHNHLASRGEVAAALAHELLHAYDHCRAADLDWTNCRHHACSEVRAASLSGDCSFKNEAMRGHWALGGQHRACVKRRAELSVAMNPHCGSGKARAAVEAAFKDCFADTAPFDRRP